MFDITTTRTAAYQMHPPTVIFAMLGFVALACALLAGTRWPGPGRGASSTASASSFVLSLTVYVILDLEFPRVGLIRVDATDKVLADLRESMK